MNLNEAEQKRRALLVALCSLGDMRRGTLTERYLPCGKSGCHCTKAGSPGHGPKYSLTYKVQGTTQTEYIRTDEVQQVREQLANHKRFEQLCGELVEVNEVLCRLRQNEAVEQSSKKNSGQRSRRKSLPRSSGC